MAINKTLFQALPAAIAVANSDCVNREYQQRGSSGSTAVDSSGNIWFFSGFYRESGSVWMCPEDGECVSKYPVDPLSNSSWSAAGDWIAVDDEGQTTLVYLHNYGGEVLQCVWEDNGAEAMFCNVFLHYGGESITFFVDHEGSTFNWHWRGDNSTDCGMSKCNLYGECDDFESHFVGGPDKKIPTSAVTDSRGNIYASHCTSKAMGESMCMHNRCTPTGECAEVEFQRHGVPLTGPISVGPDDHIYMADYDPTNDDELGLFRCSQDAVCEHISILDWPKDALEGGAWSYHDDLVKYGFSIGRNGGFYSLFKKQCYYPGRCDYDVFRQCFPEKGEEIQI